jgi:NAD(P)-dependent dehydrogenase (short-subunit alcohol dehydrogenase family)
MSPITASAEDQPGSFRLLPDETALVTGAASNIGEATARLLAREGVHVLLSDLNVDAGERIAAELTAAGLKASFIGADLSSSSEAAKLANAAIECLGNVSLFVHCACPPRMEKDTFFSVSEDTFDQMMNVNVKSGFILGRELGKHMQQRNIAGRIVYVTSLHASTTRNLPHYSASKAAETMLMKELAKALGPSGIRVNAVAPGAVKGPSANVSNEQDAAWRVKIPLQRIGAPIEVAQAVLGLVVQRFSSYITGTTIVVDGGLELYNWK